VANEIEYILFAKPNDFQEIINQAVGVEQQEQWEIDVPADDKSPKPFKLRMRKSCLKVKGVIKEESIVQTYKSKPIQLNKNEPTTVEEIDIPVDIQAWEFFLTIAQHGIIKDRYFIPIPGTKLGWEVDCFRGRKGNYLEWAKIDLEVPGKLNTLPNLPFEHTGLITNQRGFRTPQEDKTIQDFWKTMTVPNKYK
jgi:CYTH domain-containing protein